MGKKPKTPKRPKRSAPDPPRPGFWDHVVVKQKGK